VEVCRSERLKYAVVSQSAAEWWWPADDAAERLAECFEGSCGAYFVSKANLALVERQLGVRGRASESRAPCLRVSQILFGFPL
jgi:hypothetical protein